MDDAVLWDRVLDALVRVEDLAPEDCGLLSFGVDPGLGGILVEKGRICWAAAPGLQRRLKDLLATSASRSDIDLDDLYQRCRREGRLLGQTLVEEGWIAPHELESALRRHSAESLIALCQLDDVLPIWTSRGSQGYLPRFTFRPIDLLLDVVELAYPESHALAQFELARFARPNLRAVAFYWDEPADAIVPVAASGDLAVHELWALGRWATLLPLATRELGTTPSFTLATTVTSETFAVWWRESLLYAVACSDRSDVAAVAAHHLREEMR